MSIEKAAEAMYLAGSPSSHWLYASEDTRETCRKMARAALPHLMEEPTEEELLDIWNTCAGRSSNETYETAWPKLLREFVRRRNAPPEPPKSLEDSLCEEFGRVFDHQKGLGADKLTCERFGVRAVVQRMSELEAAPPEPDPRREVIIAAIKAILDSLKEPK